MFLFISSYGGVLLSVICILMRVGHDAALVSDCEKRAVVTSMMKLVESRGYRGV